MNQLQLRTDLKQMEEQFAMALPEHIKPSHVQRVVMTEVQKNPKILDCTKDSILRAVTEACQMGLVPNSVQGLAYMIPYGKTCQLIPGFRGLIKLCLQSGLVRSIRAAEVREHDEFSVQQGSSWRLIHNIDITKDRGDVVAYYAVAELPGGSTDFEVMSEPDVTRFIEKIGKKSSEVWKNHREEMAKKTCIRRLVKRLPMEGDRIEHTRLAAAADYADDSTVGMRFNQDIQEWEYQSGDPEANPSASDLNKRTENPEVAENVA